MPFPKLCIPFLIAGLVYCNLRISNLSLEFAAGIPDTKGNFITLVVKSHDPKYINEFIYEEMSIVIQGSINIGGRGALATCPHNLQEF